MVDVNHPFFSVFSDNGATEDMCRGRRSGEHVGIEHERTAVNHLFRFLGQPFGHGHERCRFGAGGHGCCQTEPPPLEPDGAVKVLHEQQDDRAL